MIPPRRRPSTGQTASAQPASQGAASQKVRTGATRHGLAAFEITQSSRHRAVRVADFEKELGIRCWVRQATADDFTTIDGEWQVLHRWP